jgi:hypothetical protein
MNLISVWPSDTPRPVNLTLQLAIHQVLQIVYRRRRIEIKLLRKLLGCRSVPIFIYQLQPNPLTSPNIFDKVFELLAPKSSSLSLLSKLVLAVAPHLADNIDTLFKDSYLNETQKCKAAYVNQKPFENLIIKAQGQKVQEPIANTIWRLVILDKYVNFKELYAALDLSYNPNDDVKDLTDKFTLLKKHTVSSRCPVLTEAEWMHLYNIWVSAVLYFYPHRRVEFASYHELIVNMFQVTLSPLPAIKYDRDSQE